MTEITLPRVPKSRTAPPGLQDLPGRNNPAVGLWLIETFCAGIREPVVADCMVGGGQLWMSRPDGVRVIGCEKVARRVDIARANGINAFQGEAETWECPLVPHLVAFSPPYPNCDHNSGATEHQKQLVESKGLQSMQAIEGVPCMWRVFANIARWRGDAPVAIIVKNYIQEQIEVDWAGEMASSMVMAGLGQVDAYFYRVKSGPTETWKVARGEFSARTGKKHRVIDREIILVARS